MNRLALITGASAGIGAAFARAYAQRGFDIAVTARRADRLEKLAGELRAAHGVETIVHTADLAALEAPAQILAALGRPVDVLVNNAGYGQGGGFGGTDWETQEASLRVMLMAPSELAHRVLPAMIAQRYGRIINVASLAGLIPPGSGLYGPIKAYLARFSQALWAETHGTGVHVTALCPGFTQSEFHDAAGTRAQVSRTPAALWSSAEDVAEAGIKACEANQAVIVTGGVNKAIAALSRVTPDALVMPAVRRMTGREKPRT